MLVGPPCRSGPTRRGEKNSPPPPTAVRRHKIEPPKAKAARHRTDASFTYSLFPYDTSVSSVLTVTEGLPTTGVTFACLPIKFPVRLLRFHRVCLAAGLALSPIPVCYELESPGIEFQWGEIFHVRPDRHRSPPSILEVFTGSFAGLKRLNRGADHHF